jgi:hypothetical protein
MRKLRKLSIAIYTRLSDEDRDKQHESDESESIQNQKAMLSDYCKERNWDIFDIYCDEDYSGKIKTNKRKDREPMKKTKLAKPLALIIIISMILTLAACSDKPIPEPIIIPDENGHVRIGAANNINQAIAAIHDGWLYYTTIAEGETIYTGSIFYRVRFDGTARERLSRNDESVNWIIIDNGWIYYLDANDRSKLYRMDLNGRNREHLNNIRTTSFDVKDSWVYYVDRNDNDHMYKLNTLDNSITKLNEERTGFITVVDDWIYYQNRDDNSSIYRMRIDGTEKTQINYNRSTVFNFVGDWIYYKNLETGTLYRVKIDGTENEEILSDEIGFHFNIVDDWIFYMNASDNDYMYRIKIDGTERERINTDSTWYITIIGDWIFYHDGSSTNCKIRFDGSERTIIQ